MDVILWMFLKNYESNQKFKVVTTHAYSCLI